MYIYILHRYNSIYNLENTEYSYLNKFMMFRSKCLSSSILQKWRPQHNRGGVLLHRCAVFLQLQEKQGTTFCDAEDQGRPLNEQRRSPLAIWFLPPGSPGSPNYSLSSILLLILLPGDQAPRLQSWQTHTHNVLPGVHKFGHLCMRVYI